MRNELLNILNITEKNLTDNDIQEILRAVKYTDKISHYNFYIPKNGHANIENKEQTKEQFRIKISAEYYKNSKNVLNEINLAVRNLVDMLDYLYSSELSINSLKNIVNYLRAIAFLNQYEYGHLNYEFDKEVENFVNRFKKMSLL